MKIITIANDTVEYTLLKANYGGEVFMTPAQINGREILSEYLANCRKVDACKNKRAWSSSAPSMENCTLLENIGAVQT